MDIIKLSDWIIVLSDHSHPRELVIEVSTRCNLTCIHCFRNSSVKFKQTDMSFENYVKIIENALNSGIKKVVFTGWGEPTNNPYILSMLRYAKSRGLYTVLNTNGVELHSYAKGLVEMGLDELYISIDAVDIELYEKIRRLGDLSRVSKAIVELNNLKNDRKTLKPIIKSIFTINKLNLEQIPKLINYAYDVGIQEVYLSFYIHHPAGIREVECISDSECRRTLKSIIEEISIKLVNLPIRVWIPNIDSYTSRECPFAACKALYVRVDGKVSPCLFLAYSWSIIVEDTRRLIKEFIIGDALTESINDIWKRFSNTYFKLFFNYMPSCLDCNMRNWCSYTLSSETDCWGNVPNCSFCPYHYKFSYCPI